MILFISDLHLEEARPDITEAFIAFMHQRAPKADALYILGDFFEAWVGDDENTPLQQQIKTELKRYVDLGKALYIQHGNRDFLIGERFCSETGAQLLDEEHLIEFDGQPYLLMHGDSLCTKDLSYQKLKQTLRNPAFMQVFLARPLEDRITTARQLRQMSQASGQTKEAEIMDVTPEEVVRKLESHECTQLIHGHTHRPTIHDLETKQGPAKRYVLGDWDKAAYCISLETDKAPILERIEFSELSNEL